MRQSWVGVQGCIWKWVEAEDDAEVVGRDQSGGGVGSMEGDIPFAWGLRFPSLPPVREIRPLFSPSLSPSSFFTLHRISSLIALFGISRAGRHLHVQPQPIPFPLRPLRPFNLVPDDDHPSKSLDRSPMRDGPVLFIVFAQEEEDGRGEEGEVREEEGVGVGSFGEVGEEWGCGGDGDGNGTGWG